MVLQQSLSFYFINLYLFHTHYLISLILNDKTIIDIVLRLKIYLPEQLYLLNLVCMKLQVIFILDLLECKTNRVNIYYTNTRHNKFTQSMYLWLEAYLEYKAIKFQKKFILLITTNNSSLLFLINTSSILFPYYIMFIRIALNQEFLRISNKEQNDTYYL